MQKKLAYFSLSFFLCCFSINAFAALLQNHKFYNYDLIFTMPECQTYNYNQPVLANNKELLYSKPQNVYCTKDDILRSQDLLNSPITKLTQWISDPTTNEVIMSYLSFSSYKIKDELCKAIFERNIKVTLILDQKSSMSAANELANCKPDEKFTNPNLPQVLTRGNTPGIVFSHTKLVIINPKQDLTRISFSSANLTFMAPLFFENWHFITTGSDTYFTQAHLCLVNGMIDHAQSGSEFKNFIKTCRASIPYPQEDDIKLYIVPGEGPQAFAHIKNGIKNSANISIAAHRFLHSELINLLEEKLQTEPLTNIKLVADDDLYWIGKYKKFPLGFNTYQEYKNVQRLQQQGLTPRYMQTNHNLRILHHNKFIIFENGSDDFIFTGAGNFTNNAFNGNFENFYVIKIQNIVEQFKNYYQKLFFDLATDALAMPAEDVHP